MAYLSESELQDAVASKRSSAEYTVKRLEESKAELEAQIRPITNRIKAIEKEMPLAKKVVEQYEHVEDATRQAVKAERHRSNNEYPWWNYYKADREQEEAAKEATQDTITKKDISDALTDFAKNLRFSPAVTPATPKAEPKIEAVQQKSTSTKAKKDTASDIATPRSSWFWS
ncbi:hypothetical protein BT63DRAFT_455007 [Microthyrium microscopicum]|uniref:Uncharacterized protein n=1 Tax=Microthyrium microscopicum TaxID=703497 RepID=A0A6A6UA21_9PEZI|nr:hypothetical protein BT63DRAFT_455007 [Microthyrium microscopicum]